MVLSKANGIIIGRFDVKNHTSGAMKDDSDNNSKAL